MYLVEFEDGSFVQVKEFDDRWSEQMDRYGGFNVLRLNEGFFEMLNINGNWDKIDIQEEKIIK